MNPREGRLLIVGGVVCFLAAGALSRGKELYSENKKPKEVPNFDLSWNGKETTVTVGNTMFVAKQPFSKGPAFHQNPTTYFPFDVSISEKGVAAFRGEIADKLPKSAGLEIRATTDPFVLREEHPSSPHFVMATSLDTQIGRDAHAAFQLRDLLDPDNLREFAQTVELKLFQWMLFNALTFPSLTTTSDPKETAGLLIAARERADDKALKLPIPVRIKAEPAFNYHQYYQNLR